MNTRSYDTTADDACEILLSDEQAVAAARRGLPAAGELAATADTFAALSDPTRLTILLALARGELCVCDLAAVTGVSQSGVSHQLRLLRQLRLVSYRRDGRRAVYRLADEHVRVLLGVGLEHAAERGGSKT